MQNNHSQEVCRAENKTADYGDTDFLEQNFEPVFEFNLAERQGTDLSWIHSPDIVRRVMDDYTALAPLYWIFRGCVEEAMNMMEQCDEHVK